MPRRDGSDCSGQSVPVENPHEVGFAFLVEEEQTTVDRERVGGTAPASRRQSRPLRHDSIQHRPRPAGGTSGASTGDRSPIALNYRGGVDVRIDTHTPFSDWPTAPLPTT